MFAQKVFLLLLSLSLITACGDNPSSQRVRETEFNDHGSPQPETADAETADTENGDSEKSGLDNAETEKPETVEPTPEQTQRQLEIDKKVYSEDRGQQVTIYQTPEPIREKVREQRPDLVVESGKGFIIEKPFLNISSKTSTMSFTAILKIDGKADENIELKCTFDKAKLPWSCDNMYPIEAAVAAERRMQATVNCADHYRWELDSYPCEDVGIEIYVVVNGKTQSQLFQTRKFSARVATSGDEEVEEQTSNLKPLENPVPAGPRIQEKSSEDSTLQPKRSTELPTKKAPPAEVPSKEVPTTEKPTKEKVTSEKPTPETMSTSIRPKARPTAQTDAEPPATLEDSIVFSPLPDEAEALNDDDLLEMLNDPSAAVEITSPIPQPKPDAGPSSIPGIEKLRPEIGSDVPNQAQGSHNNGRLQSPSQLPEDSSGAYVCRNHGEKDFGAKMMIDLIKGAARVVKKNNSSKPPIVVATIAKRSGGCVTTTSGRCHASHRNGLDVDIAFPSTSKHSDMWPACEASKQTRNVRRMGRQESRSGTFCNIGGSISSRFDTKRFWEMSRSFACAEGEPVIAMFLDPEIKKHMCNYARNNGGIGGKGTCSYKTLRAMKDEPGHFNHVHIRLRCPGNKGCRGQDSIVTLGDGTGC